MARERNEMHVVLQPLHRDVTGSCFFLRVRFPSGKKVSVIVDCGLFQGEKEIATKYNQEPLPFKADENDVIMVLLTHAHIDHLGRIPLLCKNGYRGDIYTTTLKSTIQIQLEDTTKINKLVAKQKNIKPLFTETDTEAVLNQLKVVKYGTPIVKGTGRCEKVIATFYPNAHTPGAALILLQFRAECQEDINFLFTGDYKPRDFMAKASPIIPKKVRESLKNLHIISEATYGEDKSSKRICVFERNVKNFFESGGKILLIPTFAFERAQKLLYVLKKMQNRGTLSKDIPIYTDGKLLHAHTSNLYANREKLLRREAQEFIPKNVVKVRKEQREILLSNVTSPMIVLSTSGSGVYGPAQMYILQLLSRADSMIHFTGFQFEGSFGKKLKIALEENNGLLKRKNESEIFVKCKVEWTSEFSSHATIKQLANLFNKFPNVNTIYLNHGTSEAKTNFANFLIKSEKFKSDNVVISIYNYYSRFNAYKCYQPYCRAKL